MTQSVQAPPRRMSKVQASRRLGVPVKAVDRLIERGQLASVVVPGLRETVTESSVEALVARMSGAEKQAG